MQPIEAVNVPVPQPEVPPCELWVQAWYRTHAWLAIVCQSESSCDNCMREDSEKGFPVRKFHLTDSPPPVDQAAVAEAWKAYVQDGQPTFAAIVAAFVAELVAKGVPRAI